MGLDNNDDKKKNKNLGFHLLKPCASTVLDASNILVYLILTEIFPIL